MTKQYPSKQYLSEVISNREFAESVPPEIVIVMARQLLAGLEQEPVYQVLGDGSWTDYSKQQLEDLLESKPSTLFRVAYAAPQLPQPALVDADDNFYSWFGREWRENYQQNQYTAAAKQMLGVMAESAWRAGRRSAMLQGADRPQNEPQNIPENIPATQFKPVADLYGLTSPTGGETSFTFDAVEARDFIDGGWSCQEYVELGRFQEAMLQNGNSPAQSDCCPEQNYIAPAQDGDSPVLPDGWVACSERMPDIGTEIFYFCQDDGLRDCGIVSSSNFSGKGNAELYVHAEGYDLRFGVDISHWMPLPASPQQK
nr:DUF551 domain-containing protein [Enterobacter hormaechei]